MNTRATFSEVNPYIEDRTCTPDSVPLTTAPSKNYTLFVEDINDEQCFLNPLD